MSRTSLVRVGRGLAGYAFFAALTGFTIYVVLGLSGQLVRDWIVPFAVGSASIALLSWLVIPRQPRNAGVWVLVVAAAFLATMPLVYGLAQWRLAVHGLPSDLSVLVPAELPLGTALILQASLWVWIPGLFLLLTLALLLFPDGRLPSPRWRWAVRWTVAAIVLSCALSAWSARPSVVRPAYGGDQPLDVALRLNMTIALPALFAAVVASLVAFVRRYRESAGVVRQQFRVIGWAAVVVAVSFAALTPLIAVPSIGADPLRVASVFMLPVFAGAYMLAVARYRLYEIDRIISRTASYALVTATLTLIYVGLVLGLRTLFAPFTDGSEAAVAASTLGVVAAFRPVNARVKQVVDRRFNRDVHDARIVVDEFVQSLRSEVDLETVQRELTIVAAATVKPRHASVWLARDDVATSTTSTSTVSDAPALEEHVPS